MNLSCRSYDDLLSAPTVMLGFRPTESCVVMAVSDRRVKVCVRVEVDWFITSFASTAESLGVGLGRFPGATLVLLGFSSDPVRAAVSVEQLEQLFPGQVGEMVVTDGSQYWDLFTSDPETEEGVPWDVDNSRLAAAAVFEGFTLHRDRDAAVKEVREPPVTADLKEALARARREVGDLESPMPVLRRLMTSGTPLSGPDAAVLAVLLESEECMAEVLSTLDAVGAVTSRRRLTEARRATVGPRSANVIGLLGMACWLDGNGSLAMECLHQISAIDPTHPLAAFLDMVQRDALPPDLWGGAAPEEEVPVE